MKNQTALSIFKPTMITNTGRAIKPAEMVIIKPRSSIESEAKTLHWGISAYPYLELCFCEPPRNTKNQVKTNNIIGKTGTALATPINIPSGVVAFVKLYNVILIRVSPKPSLYNIITYKESH